MAIEIIQKSEVKKSKWAMTLFIVCIVAFTILAGSYAYFFIASSQTSKTIQEKKTPPKIKRIKKEILIMGRYLKNIWIKN